MATILFYVGLTFAFIAMGGFGLIVLAAVLISSEDSDLWR